MKVKLLHYTPIWLIANAVRMSRDNHHLSDTLITEKCPSCKSNNTEYKTDGEEVKWYFCYHCGLNFSVPINKIKVGEKDFDLIKRVGIKLKHESVLEFGYFIWEIDGISRACLQELARHRLANLTVKSTRYTLKELKNEEPFVNNFERSHKYKRAEKYIVMTGKLEIDFLSVRSLENLRQAVASGKSNDITKYVLPEAFKTKLQWGINLRSFLNFYKLRSSKDALWEIRELAGKLKESLPNKYQELVELYISK